MKQRWRNYALIAREYIVTNCFCYILYELHATQKRTRPSVFRCRGGRPTATAPDTQRTFLPRRTTEHRATADDLYAANALDTTVRWTYLTSGPFADLSYRQWIQNSCQVMIRCTRLSIYRRKNP
jgi:hypothetical protein